MFESIHYIWMILPVAIAFLALYSLVAPLLETNPQNTFHSQLNQLLFVSICYVVAYGIDYALADYLRSKFPSSSLEVNLGRFFIYPAILVLVSTRLKRREDKKAEKIRDEKREKSRQMLRW